eukprot:CAMPEP_0204588898 /NCGR_PEP_ID=MMETSP0661-20131031/48886_1 /ASSEMBLY_ACC=CAM_ASM_000606 /TAXON_ID=109239 /ORGANISM="Alexandrium margalefi, Strain AMGDE01CS-322" /LENGTH=238 /DNA_ID=CAMNT_0051598759 /DNA_START=60 /DNA_END=772 /DNA_ORIENTATION=+
MNERMTARPASREAAPQQSEEQGAAADRQGAPAPQRSSEPPVQLRISWAPPLHERCRVSSARDLASECARRRRRARQIQGRRAAVVCGAVLLLAFHRVVREHAQRGAGHHGPGYGVARPAAGGADDVAREEPGPSAVPREAETLPRELAGGQRRQEAPGTRQQRWPQGRRQPQEQAGALRREDEAEDAACNHAAVEGLDAAARAGHLGVRPVPHRQAKGAAPPPPLPQDGRRQPLETA